MSVAVQCEQCQAKYVIDDKFAGKKAKCKRCGHIMSIPAAAGARDPDLISLEDAQQPDDANETSPWGGPATPPPSAAHPQGVTSSPGRGWRPQDVVVEREGPVDEIPLSSPFPTYVRRQRQTGPTLDWLVPVCILALVASLIALGVILRGMLRAHVTEAQWEAVGGQVTAYVWGFVVFALVGFFVLAAPATLAGIFAGAKIRKTELPGSAYARAAAVAAVPASAIVLIATGVVNQVMDASLAMLILLASVPLAFLVLRFAFGFDWLTAGVAFALAAVIGGVAVVTNNKLAQRAAEQVFLKTDQSNLSAYAKARETQRPGGATPSPSPGSDTPAPGPAPAAQSAQGPTASPAVDPVEARRISEDNLRKFGSALNAYYLSNNSTWPPNVAAALATQLVEASTLKSPYGPAAGGTDYVYTPGPAGTSGSAELVLAYDRAEYEKHGRATVLFGDMSVRWLDRSGVDQALARSQAIASAPAVPTRPAPAVAVSNNPPGGAQPPPGGPRDPGAVGPAQPGAGAPIAKAEAAAAFEAKLREKGDKLVSAVNVVPLDPSVVSVIRPAAPSTAFAVVRSNGQEDTIDVWSDNPPKKVGQQLVYKVEPAVRSTYALSADGQNLLRVSSFPKLSAKMVSVADGRELSSVDLDSSNGTPVLLALLPDRAVIRWENRLRGLQYGIQAVDLRRGKIVRQFALTNHDPSPGNEAVSPDGRMFATASREVVRGKSASFIVLHSLIDGGTTRKMPIDALDDLWSIRPAGIAFSPDSARVAALFAKDGNGLIVGWSLRTTARSFPKQGIVVPGGMVQPLQPLVRAGHGAWQGAMAASGSGRSLSWLANGNALLVGGAQVLDAADGRLIGDLGVNTLAFDQTAGGDNAVYLPFKDKNAAAGMAIVQLDPKLLPGAGAGTAASPGASTKPAGTRR